MASDGETAPVRLLLERTRTMVDDWVELDAGTFTVDETGDLMAGLDRQIHRLEAARTRLAGSFARRDGHRRSGHKSLSHWMQDRLRRSPTQARKEARTAERLAGLSATDEALGDGDISLEHAAAIAEEAGRSDDPEDAQRSLLAEARTGDPRRVRKTGRRMRRQADRRAEDAYKVRRARQQRTFSFQPDEAAKTMFVQGRLPMLEGLKVRTAIDALAAPRDSDDERSYGQRMADGLVALVDRAADSTTGLPDQRGVPVEVMAVVPVDAIEGRAGTPVGTICGGPGGGIDLSDAELAQLLRRAGLSWLIVDPDGLPLRYGKTRRYASDDQRRVIRARDGGCAWPKCDAPAHWCLVHHEPPYDEPDGATDVCAMCGFCDVHHEMRHKGGWTVELDPDGTITVTSPDGSIVLTETARQRRARHGTYELSTRQRAGHAHTGRTDAAPAGDDTVDHGPTDHAGRGGEQTALDLGRSHEVARDPPAA